MKRCRSQGGAKEKRERLKREGKHSIVGDMRERERGELIERVSGEGA